MFKTFLQRIRTFGLYINGRRVSDEGFQVKTNPFSGRVIGNVFLSPQELSLLNELSPTLDDETPTEEATLSAYNTLDSTFTNS